MRKWTFVEDPFDIGDKVTVYGLSDVTREGVILEENEIWVVIMKDGRRYDYRRSNIVMIEHNGRGGQGVRHGAQEAHPRDDPARKDQDHISEGDPLPRGKEAAVHAVH